MKIHYVKETVKMPCENGKCEFNPTLIERKAIRSIDDIRYGELWAEVELPRLLKEKEIRE
jgi:hypothetical protein